MDRAYAETIVALLREQYGRMFEDDDGTAELGRLIAAAAWPEAGVPVAPSVWLDGYLAAGVLSPLGAEPNALYSAAAERFCNGGDGQEAEPFLTFMTNRYEALQAAYGETRRVVAMFEAADDLGMTDWAQGFAQGVRIMETGWPTEMFIAAERRMVSLLARLAEGGTGGPGGLCRGGDVYPVAMGGKPGRRNVTRLRRRRSRAATGRAPGARFIRTEIARGRVSW